MSEQVKICPKCKRSWPHPCEQTVCIELFNECVVCRFGVNGTGTKDELDSVVNAHNMTRIHEFIVPLAQAGGGESDLTGAQWSAARKVFEEYANKVNSADKYEMASAYLDAAPQAIYDAILAAQEQK